MAQPSSQPSQSNFSTQIPFVEERVEPVNGIVQPNYIPPPHKPHRNTNQLQYILKILNRNLWKHQYAWPFQTPVDTIKLQLPDYHTLIKRPMDLGTIKKRLENYWYYSAEECLGDFSLLFENCYLYNKPEEDVVFMARSIQRVLNEKIVAMPPEEIEIPIPVKGSKGSRKGKARGGGGRGEFALDAFWNLLLTVCFFALQF